MTDWKFDHADHLSPSQITEYLACPACFYLNRIKRVPRATSIALPIGGAVHKGIEAMRLRVIAAGDYTHDDMLDVAAEHFDKSIEAPEEDGTELILDIGDYGSVGEAKDHTMKLTSFALGQVRELDALRRLVAAEMDLSEFASPWPFPMHGRIDALYGSIQDTGDIIVTAGADLKTSSKQMAPTFLAALQIGIYRTFVPGTWFADVVAKTRMPTFRSYTLDNEGDEFLFDTVMDVATRIKAGDFPARPGYLCKYEHGNPKFSVTVAA